MYQGIRLLADLGTLWSELNHVCTCRYTESGGQTAIHAKWELGCVGAHSMFLPGRDYLILRLKWSTLGLDNAARPRGMVLERHDGEGPMEISYPD